METKLKLDEPAACIVCLNCLNNGRALGKWATIEQIAEETTAEQISYIGQGETATYPSGANYIGCKTCGGDEWELIDYEYLPHSSRNLKALYENAEQISELHNNNELAPIILLASWLDVGGYMSINELVAYNEANYIGEYNTPKDFAEYMADALAIFDGTENEIVANCFDYEQYYYGWLQHDYTEEQGHYWRNA
jgi:antirestriction protein